jgi:serine/threonine-protein kinase RsbW
MRTHTTKTPQAITFERAYPGAASQARHVRADLTAFTGTHPAADDLVLLASELAANAAVHSRSGHPGGKFTVRVFLYPGDYAWTEVIDQGGPWTSRDRDDERSHGLDIVAAIAGADNWGIESGPAVRVVWFRLDWAEPS